MVTGAAQADAALLLVDAAEGVREQSRRHGYLLQLLGVRQVVVVVNKMDLVGYRRGALRASSSRDHRAISIGSASSRPPSSRSRRARATASSRARRRCAWYDGPTVVEALDASRRPGRATELPLRLPVQEVYKFDDRRIIAGRIESGRIAVGDEIVVAPAGRTARVRSIEAWPVADRGPAPSAAGAGRSIGITLDRELFVERGDVLCAADGRARRGAPGHGADLLAARRAARGRRRRHGAHRGRAGGRRRSRRSATRSIPARRRRKRRRVVGAEPYRRGRDRAVGADRGRYARGQPAHRPDRARLSRAASPAAGSCSRSMREAQSAARRPPAAELTRRAAGAHRRAGRARRRPSASFASARRSTAGSSSPPASAWRTRSSCITSCEAGLDIDVVTLDTGRLFPETYATWEETERRYGRRIRAIYPRHDALEALVAAQGINGFYRSREARAACCDVRKVEPLGRALAGARAWITGLRADQSAQRGGVALVEADRARGLLKLNPLFDWTREAVVAFAREHEVPINPLHEQGLRLDRLRALHARDRARASPSAPGAGGGKTTPRRSAGCISAAVPGRDRLRGNRGSTTSPAFRIRRELIICTWPASAPGRRTRWLRPLLARACVGGFSQSSPSAPSSAFTPTRWRRRRCSTSPTIRRASSTATSTQPSPRTGRSKTGETRHHPAVAWRLGRAGARGDRRARGRRRDAGARRRHRRHRREDRQDPGGLAEAAAEQLRALHLDHRVPGAQGQSEGHQGLGRPGQGRRRRSSRRTRRPRAARAGTISPPGPGPTQNNGGDEAKAADFVARAVPATCRCSTPARAARPRPSRSAASATCCSPGRTRPFWRSTNSAPTSSRSSIRRSRSWPSRRSRVVDGNVDAKGTRKVAEAYLDFLYTPEGQAIVAKQLLPPARRRNARPPTMLAQLPEARRWSPSTSDFGGWDEGAGRRTSPTAASSTRSTSRAS